MLVVAIFAVIIAAWGGWPNHEPQAAVANASNDSQEIPEVKESN